MKFKETKEGFQLVPLFFIDIKANTMLIIRIVLSLNHKEIGYMNKKKIVVSKRAVNLVNDMTKNGKYRGDAFKEVDELFFYPENTMAMYFGRLESAIIVGGKTKQKQKRNKKYLITKPRKQRIWEKKYGFGELKKVLRNQKRGV